MLRVLLRPSVAVSALGRGHIGLFFLRRRSDDSNESEDGFRSRTRTRENYVDRPRSSRSFNQEPYRDHQRHDQYHDRRQFQPQDQRRDQTQYHDRPQFQRQDQRRDQNRQSHDQRQFQRQDQRHNQHRQYHDQQEFQSQDSLRDRYHENPQKTMSVKYRENRGSDSTEFQETDPDSFGTLSSGRHRVVDEVSAGVGEEIRAIKHKTESIQAEEEPDDKLFIPEDKWTMKKLKRRIQDLLKERQLIKALDTFHDVLQDGGFQYDEEEFSYLYKILISECGKAGHVQQAYRLYTDMKRRGYRVTPPVYTALFNSCANSPWEGAENLKRIAKIRASMEERGFVPNIMHFHAMIKAYGRCGDIESAFSIVDEMMAGGSNENGFERIRPVAETFCFLLQACITDKENGFRSAILTWTKMNDMRIRPNLYHYNLLLRAIRECGIQDQSSSKNQKREDDGQKKAEVFTSIKKGTGRRPRPLHISPSASAAITENISSFDLACFQKENTQVDEDLGNYNGETQMSLPVMKSSLEVIQSLNVPENRLAVLGGLRAFTSQLDRDRVRPDLKTLTELVQIVPTKEIQDVLMLLESNEILPDVYFFNMIMKRYITFKELDKAREVVKKLSSYHVTPNIQTWGILATACPTWGDAAGLLREMDDVGIVPNEIILGAIIVNACKAYDPRYMLRIMEEQIRREIQPDQYFVDHVTHFKTTLQRAVVDHESGREVYPRRLSEIIGTEFFREYWEKFKLRHRRWVKEIEVRTEPQNPWKEDYYNRIERLKKRREEIK